MRTWKAIVLAVIFVMGIWVFWAMLGCLFVSAWWGLMWGPEWFRWAALAISLFLVGRYTRQFKEGGFKDVVEFWKRLLLL